MLCAVPGDIAFGAAQEDARPQADGAQVGIVEERAELASGGIGNITAARQQHAHIGVENALGRIGGGAVILVGVAGVKEEAFV